MACPRKLDIRLLGKREFKNFKILKLLKLENNRR